MGSQLAALDELAQLVEAEECAAPKAAAKPDIYSAALQRINAAGTLGARPAATAQVAKQAHSRRLPQQHTPFRLLGSGKRRGIVIGPARSDRPAGTGELLAQPHSQAPAQALLRAWVARLRQPLTGESAGDALTVLFAYTRSLEGLHYQGAPPGGTAMLCSTTCSVLGSMKPPNAAPRLCWSPLLPPGTRPRLLNHTLALPQRLLPQPRVTRTCWHCFRSFPWCSGTPAAAACARYAWRWRLQRWC